ncbi:NAD(P)-binding protein [Pholiota conissans]|uniref:NAD(P)-binding protein n=1 Tax=Pholiota conissans TaxID=109636 RepID=A0A9P5ZCR9_9AGAR|nr:NAD(P)-binding protein [Pholiota conissans]
MTKVVLITGANSGIGFELARLISEKGHVVYIGSRNETSGKKAVNTLHSEGFTSVKLCVIDVTQHQSIKAAAETIAAAEGKLDILVNNAGVYLPDENQNPISPSLDAIRAIMETNFFGVIQTTAAFIPLLRKSTSKAPVIVNVSSGLGSNASRAQAGPDAYDFAGYNASKAALNAYTIALSHELLKEGFKVNVVAPGYTATKLTGGQGQPVRNGALALFRWALLDESGPTGKFFEFDGTEKAW